MKNSISVMALFFVTFAGSLLCAPTAEANGWATAGKILAGVAGADLLFNGRNSMAGRTVTGVGSIFTGGGCYSRPQTCAYGYAQPAPVVYGYSQPAPRAGAGTRSGAYRGMTPMEIFWDTLISGCRSAPNSES